MKSTIFDSDLNLEKLDQLISSNRELEVLKFLGEISVEIEGDLEEEDNRFDAPYQEEMITGGSIDYKVKDFKVFWNPDEKELEVLEDCVEEGSLSKDLFKLVKNKFYSEPRKTLSYEITLAIEEDPLEELKNEFLEENRE